MCTGALSTANEQNTRWIGRQCAKWMMSSYLVLIKQTLLNTKYLDSLPPRILQFHLRLAKFDYTVSHVPGKLLYTADALSRAPVSPATLTEDDSFQEDA